MLGGCDCFRKHVAEFFSAQALGCDPANEVDGMSEYRMSNKEFRMMKFDGLVRCVESPFSVIPANPGSMSGTGAGIQFIHRVTKHLDSGDPVPAKAGNRRDDFLRTHQP